MNMNISLTWEEGIPLPEKMIPLLKEASEEELRALLLLIILGGNSEAVTQKGLSELGMTNREFNICLYFWEEKGILPLISTEKQQKKPVLPPEIKASDVLQSKDLQYLAHRAEEILCTTLSSNDITALFELNKSYALSVPVLEELLLHCASLGKTGMPYIKKVAYTWASEGIASLQQAKEKITEFENAVSYEARIKRLFGIQNRALTSYEKKHVKAWETLNMSDEMMLLAFDKTIAATDGKLTFNYLNAILTNWDKAGIRTLEQAEQADIERKNRGKAKQEQENQKIDYDAIRKKAQAEIRSDE